MRSDRCRVAGARHRSHASMLAGVSAGADLRRGGRACQRLTTALGHPTPDGVMFRGMTQLHDLTLLEQADAVRRREVSPVELVDHYLARIERPNDEIGAFVFVAPD